MQVQSDSLLHASQHFGLPVTSYSPSPHPRAQCPTSPGRPMPSNTDSRRESPGPVSVDTKTDSAEPAVPGLRSLVMTQVFDNEEVR